MKFPAHKKTISVTSNDVARLAKVSQATVSRVFNNKGYVKEDTANKVRQAAQELGYMPNEIARSLTSSRTNLIAVVSVNFNNPFYQTMLIKISRMINSLQKKMLFIESAFEQELDDILYQVLQYQVDGVIVFSAALSSKMSEEFTRVKIPLVIFNKHFDSRYFFSVCSDNVDSGAMVAHHLIQKGFDSFGYISGDNLRQTSENRYQGFTKYLQEQGFDRCALANGDFSYESGYEALLRMDKQGPLPRAVFCANDLMAFGAMDAAREVFGLRIPEDIAFVGFDNLEQSDWKTYKLTSVAQPIDDMVEYTRDYLAKKMSNVETCGGYILLKCRMVEREST